MLTPYLPFPTSSGGQIRSFNLIKNLSKKHEITLFSLIKYAEEERYVSQLKKYCKDVFVFKRPKKPWTLKNILNTAFSLKPFLIIRNYSSTEKKALEEILKEKKFDIIHAETFYVSPHIPQTTTPIVLVDQTIEYQVYLHFVENFRFLLLRPILYLDVLKIKYWEEHYWKKAARVVAVSKADAAVMRSLSKNIQITVIPNGVGEDLMEEIPLHFSKSIVFVGNYAWLQNTEAVNILVNKIFPLIKQKLNGVKLIIAGQNTSKIVKPSTTDVEFIDLEMDDIEGIKKFFRTSGILVAPLYGPGGTRLKILGAMASKLPVITTPVGIEGIEARNFESVLCGNTYKELANLSVKVLSDKKLYEKIANNGRRLVQEKYTYKNISQKLDKVYREIANG